MNERIFGSSLPIHHARLSLRLRPEFRSALNFCDICCLLFAPRALSAAIEEWAILEILHPFQPYEECAAKERGRKELAGYIASGIERGEVEVMTQKGDFSQAATMNRPTREVEEEGRTMHAFFARDARGKLHIPVFPTFFPHHVESCIAINQWLHACMCGL